MAIRQLDVVEHSRTCLPAAGHVEPGADDWDLVVFGDLPSAVRHAAIPAMESETPAVGCIAVMVWAAGVTRVAVDAPGLLPDDHTEAAVTR